MRITPDINLPEVELEERFIRAPGPGGQNVNKVETAVQLRFDAGRSECLPAAVYRRLARLAGSRMSRDGVIVITANKFRSQAQNRRDARERLADLIRQAAIAPKQRRPTRPTRAARAQRMDSKRRRGVVKSRRGKVTDSE